MLPAAGRQGDPVLIYNIIRSHGFQDQALFMDAHLFQQVFGDQAPVKGDPNGLLVGVVGGLVADAGGQGGETMDIDRDIVFFNLLRPLLYSGQIFF